MADRTVEALYQAVLERSPGAAERRLLTAGLRSGELVPRAIQQRLCASEEYRDRFIRPFSPGRAVRDLFRRVCGRPPDREEFRRFYTGVAHNGYGAAIRGLFQALARREAALASGTPDAAAISFQTLFSADEDP